jgi:hypothetical protein
MGGGGSRIEECACAAAGHEYTASKLPIHEWAKAIGSTNNKLSSPSPGISLHTQLWRLGNTTRPTTGYSCENLCSMSGQLDALNRLEIYGCNELQSLDSLGHLPSLESLYLGRCKRLASVPGALGSYSALRRLSIIYCPAIDMKPLYERHQQRLDSLEERDLSHARSSNPREGTFQSNFPLLYAATILHWYVLTLLFRR